MTDRRTNLLISKLPDLLIYRGYEAVSDWLLFAVDENDAFVHRTRLEIPHGESNTFDGYFLERSTDGTIASVVSNVAIVVGCARDSRVNENSARLNRLRDQID